MRSVAGLPGAGILPPLRVHVRAAAEQKPEERDLVGLVRRDGSSRTRRRRCDYRGDGRLRPQLGSQRLNPSAQLLAFGVQLSEPRLGAGETVSMRGGIRVNASYMAVLTAEIGSGPPAA